MTKAQLYIGTELYAFLEDKRNEQLWESDSNEAPAFREVVLDCLSDEAKEEFYSEYHQGNAKYNRAS